MYAAIVEREGETFLFLSPDEKEYIGIKGGLPPIETKEDAEIVRKNVVSILDGDGRTKPMRYARRFFTTIAPHEEKVKEVSLWTWDAETGEWQCVDRKGDLRATR